MDRSEVAPVAHVRPPNRVAAALCANPVPQVPRKVPPEEEPMRRQVEREAEAAVGRMNQVCTHQLPPLPCVLWSGGVAGSLEQHEGLLNEGAL